MRADLHCHSKYSDSSVSVEDLVRMAKLNKIDAIAITDHDTFAGQSEAVQFGDRYGVKIVPGIELSGYDYHRGEKAHILCYYPKQPKALNPVCEKVRKSRYDTTLKMVHRICELFPVSEEMIFSRAKDSTNIYKQHIMHTLIDAGYARDFFGELYKKLFSPKDGLANYEIVYPDVYEILEAVKAARGIAVVAHPGESKKEGLLRALAEQNLIDGIELYCPKNSEKMQAEVREIAAQYDLLLTAGTDFHGMYSSRTNCVGTYTMPGEWLAQLEERAAQK